MGKVVMAGIANVEPVSLFVMLFAVTFGWKALCPIFAFPRPVGGESNQCFSMVKWMVISSV